jgi:hypothetical protein
MCAAKRIPRLSVFRPVASFAPLAAWAWWSAGCAGTPDEAELRIKVIDARSRAPLVGTLISIEKGGIYVSNPDPSRGNPSFVYGALIGDEGTFSLMLPTDELGVHSFAPGHYYGARRVELDQDLGITINMEAFQANELAPTISNAQLDPATVAPGADFTVSADVAHGDANDPLSEEVIVTFPAELRSRALDPPSPGIQGTAFPDGVWRATLTAPSQAGSYVYYLSATSEGCVTSDIVALTLEVQ